MQDLTLESGDSRITKRPLESNDEVPNGSQVTEIRSSTQPSEDKGGKRARIGDVHIPERTPSRAGSPVVGSSQAAGTMLDFQCMTLHTADHFIYQPLPPTSNRATIGLPSGQNGGHRKQ